MDSPRDRFAALAALPDARIDLAEAALCIAAEACPGLEAGRWIARLDALADAARARIEAAESTLEKALVLVEFLYAEKGFKGNARDYDDPRNSYLHEVLTRKTGIPITLALVAMEVGRRCGLAVEGVGFPGHFLVKVICDEGELVIDPFCGARLSEADCAALLRAAVGEDARWDPEWLRAAGKREILARMLRNLKRIHVARGELEAAVGCCDRILLLLPDAAEELRERARLWAELECFGSALADLERYAGLVPREAGSKKLRQELATLRQKTASIH